MLINFFLKFKQIFFNKEEKIFIINNKTNFKKTSIDTNKKTILFLIHTDHFFLLYWKILIRQKFKNNYNYLGIWPHSIIRPLKKNYLILEIFHKIKGKIYYRLIKKKWEILYKLIGVQIIYDLEDYQIHNKQLLKIKANRIFYSIKKKSDVFNIKLNNINIGDLIYDTYIRFRSRPTVDIKDNFLKDVIYKSILTFEMLDSINNKFKIDYYFSVFCVYINQGLPVRFLLKKNIKVYSWANFYFYLKKIEKNHWYDENVYLFKKNFLKFTNKKKLINNSKLELLKKLKNNSDFSAHPVKFFSEKNSINQILYLDKNKIINKSKGVLFLQCFYDAPHYYGTGVFNDHYEWTVYTLQLIKKYNLPIAIKKHPNALEESKKIFNRLQLNYSELNWLPDTVLNIDLLKNKNVVFFISNTGSILYEAAFAGKTSISGGANRTSSYNFSYNPKSVNEYKNILLNLKKKIITKKNKNEICQIYHQSFLDSQDVLNTIASKIKLMNFKFFSMKLYYNKLNYFDKKINRLINFNYF